MGLGVIRIRSDGRFELLLRVGDLAAVPQNDALVVQRIRVAAATGGRAGAAATRGGQLHRLGARGRGLVELARRVVHVREAAVRFGVVRLDFDRLLVSRFSRRVVLLLRRGVRDVVIAVVAARIHVRRRLELRDRVVVVAGAAGRDAFFERLLQLRVLRGCFLGRAQGRRGAENQVGFGGSRNRDADFRDIGHDFVFLGRDLVTTGHQPDLVKLAFLVRLRLEMTARPVSLDRDFCVLDGLALHIFHNASHHPRRLRGGRQRHRQCGERDARDQPRKPAVHAAHHGNPPEMRAKSRVTGSLPRFRQSNTRS